MDDKLSNRISIELKVTDRCNHCCFHCVNNETPGKGTDLDCEQFLKRMDVWYCGRDRSKWEIKELRMTGGEPLVNLQTVARIADACRKYRIRSGINTNGSLLTLDSAKLLKNSGLAIVKISFDTCDERVFRMMRGRGASMTDTLNGISVAVQQGFLVILRYTLCRYNAGELAACYRFAREAGAHTFQVKPLIRAGRALNTEAFLNRDEVVGALNSLASAVSNTAAAPQVLCWPPEASGGLKCKACGSIDKIYVATNGDVFICNYISTHAAIGSLAIEPLEDILNKRSPRIWRSPFGHAVLEGCIQTDFF